LGVDGWCGEQMAPTPWPRWPPLRDRTPRSPGVRSLLEEGVQGRESLVLILLIRWGQGGSEISEGSRRRGIRPHTHTHPQTHTTPPLYRRRVVYWFGPLCPLCFSDRWGQGARLSPSQIPGDLLAYQTQAWRCHIPVIQRQDVARRHPHPNIPACGFVLHARCRHRAKVCRVSTIPIPVPPAMYPLTTRCNNETHSRP